MDIALFGASGHTGSLLLATAVERGWRVRALVRQRAKLTPRDGLTVFAGDARDEAAVREVVRGTGAVLCTLGMADITQPLTDFSDSVKTIVRAMQAERVRRIVLVASAGVLDHPDGGYRHQHGAPDWLEHVSAEHQRNYETLRDSGLEWTVMCPLMLVDDIAAGHARRGLDALPEGSEETGYADLALAMADLLADRESWRHRIGIVSDRNPDAAGRAPGAS